MSTEKKIIQWNVAHSFMMLPAFIYSFEAHNFVLAACAFTGSLLAVLFSCRKDLVRFPGYANTITITRAILVGVVTVLPLEPLTHFYLFLILILSDLLDGFFARKFEESSTLGTYLDMESDAYIVFAMSYVLYFEDKLFVFLLFPAGLRYLYGVIISLLRINEVAEPKRKFASNFAGIYFGVLVASFMLPYAFRILPQVFTGLLICFSFGRSFIYQWKSAQH